MISKDSQWSTILTLTIGTFQISQNLCLWFSLIFCNFFWEAKTKTKEPDKQQVLKGINSGRCQVLKTRVIGTTRQSTSASRQGIKFHFYEDKARDRRPPLSLTRLIPEGVRHLPAPVKILFFFSYLRHRPSKAAATALCTDQLQIRVLSGHT